MSDKISEKRTDGSIEAAGQVFRVLFHLITFERATTDTAPMSFSFGRIIYTDVQLRKILWNKRDERQIFRIKCGDQDEKLLIAIIAQVERWDDGSGSGNYSADFVFVGSDDSAGKPIPQINERFNSSGRSQWGDLL